MMGERWYVCADARRQEAIAGEVRRSHPMATIMPAADAWQIRRRLITEMPGSSSVAVGTGCAGVDPVNLAAALAVDGHAAEVVLFAPSPSGSLLSRAARAGIDEVRDELGLPSASASSGTDESLERDAPTPGRVAAEGGGARPRHAGSEWRRPAHPRPVVAAIELSDDAGEIDEPDHGEDPAQPVGGELPRESIPRPQAPSPLRPETSVPAHACPIVVIASGRGGVGKTSLATTGACIASSWGVRVGLVDLDLSFGNAFSFMGMSGPADLALLSEPCSDERERVARSARKVAEGLTMWGPCSRPELAELVVPEVGTLLSRVSKEVDLVIVDTASDWGDELAVACQMADRLVLVADERAGAVASLSRAATLAIRLGVARTRIERVVNRCDRRRRDEGFLARADMGFEAARTHRILDGGADVAELLSAGHARELAMGEGDFGPSVAAWMASTLSELGSLPDVPEAKKAVGKKGRQARRMPFGLGRQAS